MGDARGDVDCSSGDGGTMVERRDVEFGVEGRDQLRGWLFLPSNKQDRFLPSPSPMVMRGSRSTGSSASPAPSLRPVSSRSSMTIGISARATVQFDMTSIPGARSRIGGERSILKSQPEVDAMRIESLGHQLRWRPCIGARRH